MTDQSNTVFVNNIPLSHVTNSIDHNEINKAQKLNQNIKPVYESVQLNLVPSKKELKNAKM